MITFVFLFILVLLLQVFPNTYLGLKLKLYKLYTYISILEENVHQNVHSISVIAAVCFFNLFQIDFGSHFCALFYLFYLLVKG